MTRPQIIQLSPNHSNIRYVVVEASREFDVAFRWLVDEMLEKKRTLPRVLVFCRSIMTCTHLYKMFSTELQENSHDPPSSMHSIQNRLFAMFHSRVDDDDKTKIMEGVKDQAGADIRTVIHYGPSSDVDDYIQEAGHAGRDGQPSKATLYY